VIRAPPVVAGTDRSSTYLVSRAPALGTRPPANIGGSVKKGGDPIIGEVEHRR